MEQVAADVFIGIGLHQQICIISPDPDPDLYQSWAGSVTKVGQNTDIKIGKLLPKKSCGKTCKRKSMKVNFFSHWESF